MRIDDKALDDILSHMYAAASGVRVQIQALERLAELGKERTAFDTLVTLAYEEARLAPEVYPPPNYLTLKIAEQAGEVVKAVIRHDEGRVLIPDVEKAIIQLLAMLMRYVGAVDVVPAAPPAAPIATPAAPPTGDCTLCIGTGSVMVPSESGALVTARCPKCSGTGHYPANPVPREQW